MQQSELTKRHVKPAIIRGLSRKCPNCGEGAIFDGYLSVNDHCPSCNEELFHQRADDGPAWATMLIAGHLLPPIVLGVYDIFEDPPPWVVAFALCTLFVMLVLLMLPRVKAAFIAIQWANYMYGFDPSSAQIFEPRSLDSPAE